MNSLASNVIGGLIGASIIVLMIFVWVSADRIARRNRNAASRVYGQRVGASFSPALVRVGSAAGGIVGLLMVVLSLAGRFTGHS